ncbi:MAG: hypothetical protein LKJ69_09700 [Lactobacillus sp.]|jgi:hypothetical protein|nr:hypothetical protein [Lactobacillus sp.]MCI2033635.1 hypothetical protein [Lactobacillus sp.]
MIETVAIALFVFALLVMEFNQQRRLKFAAHTPRVKYVVAPLLSLGLVAMFWTGDVRVDARLIILAVLLCSVAMLRQGLGDDKVVTYGSVLAASNYARYDLITYEAQAARLIVTFRSKKSGSYSLFFTEKQPEVIKFLKHLVGVQTMPEAEYERQQADKQKREVNFNREAVQVIRNRRRKSVKEILHDSAQNKAKTAPKKS